MDEDFSAEAVEGIVSTPWSDPSATPLADIQLTAAWLEFSDPFNAPPREWLS